MSNPSRNGCTGTVHSQQESRFFDQALRCIVPRYAAFQRSPNRSSARLCQDPGRKPAISGHRHLLFNLLSARIRTITEMSELESNEHTPLSPRWYQTDAKIVGPPADNRQDRGQRNDKSGNVDSRGADHQLLSRLQSAADRLYQHRR